MLNGWSRLVRGAKLRWRERIPLAAGTGAGRFAFTAEQQQIIALSEGRHLVLAPPGTGKTEMLAQRILWAVGHGVDPARMICLTFTIRAACNMQERINRRIHARLPLTIGNVHHFCAALLREQRWLPPAWSVIDEPTQRVFLEEVVAGWPAARRHLLLDSGGQLPVNELLAVCRHLRRRELAIPLELAGDPRGERVYRRVPDVMEELQQVYRRHKEAFHVLDFDDLLTYAYAFVVQQRRLPASALYTWVQVDEVQDLNPLQWAIIEGIQAPDAHGVYLGDSEQAIFSFMGASTASLTRLAAGCRLHRLYRNFRSPSYLLNVFVRYAQGNLAPPWPQPPVAARRRRAARGDCELIVVEGTAREERLALLRLLQTRRQRARRARQTAFLLRDNQTAEAYAATLQQAGVPVFKISGFDLMGSEPMLDLKAYFAALVHADDRLAWARMFRLLGSTQTQRAARLVVQALADAGIRPPDLVPDGAAAVPVTAAFARAVAGRRVVVFDTETTGLDPGADDIIQLAAVEVVGGEPGMVFETYLRTERPLGDSAAVHGITEGVLAASGVDPAEGLSRFLAFVGGDDLVAHQASFDCAMLRQNLWRRGIAADLNGRACWDTCDLARRLHPGLQSYSLAGLIATLQVQGVNSHDALDDARATVQLMLRLQTDAMALEPRQRRLLQTNGRVIQAWLEGWCPLWERYRRLAGVPTDYRRETEHFFASVASRHAGTAPGDGPEHADLMRRLEPFLAYTDRKFPEAPFDKLLTGTLRQLQRLKEPDLLLGDEPVIVSTIHKAKGLEFDSVIIPHCLDGVYPHFLSKRANPAGPAIEEDARLLYVAMTRARRQLVISWPTRTGAAEACGGDPPGRQEAPGGRAAVPSPFLQPVLPLFRLRRERSTGVNGSRGRSPSK